MGSGKIIISGSGISGLMSALLLCKRGRGKDIVIIEKSSEPGGLLRRYNYGENGDFDYGMHNFLETGIKEVDELIYNLLPENEWQLLEKEKRDLAGIYFNGKLQQNTPYIDLRNLNDEDRKSCLDDFFRHLDKEKNNSAAGFKNVREFAENRFGKVVAEKTVLSAVQKIHRRSAEELDYMASVFTPMTRITLGDERLSNELTKSEQLRNVIAWSDQRTLPIERSSGRRAMYPVNYGAYRVVNSMLKILKDNGVQILVNCEITGIETKENRISAIELKRDVGQEKISEAELLIWTGNFPLLGKMINAMVPGLKPDAPQKTIINNILVDKPLDMGDLYYFYCYDKGFNTFRLSNYINYSANAKRNGGYPVCIEFLMEEEQVKRTESLEKLAEQELFSFGITQPGTKVIFSKSEILDAGFPMPTVNNISGLKKVREKIREKNLSNLFLFGILAEDNLFFQTDVLIDLHKKIDQYAK